MAFRRSDLQEAFFVPGTYAFRVWGYGTSDPLEEVLAPNYFKAAGELRPGELIYVSTTPEPVHAGGPENGEVRVALVMVRGAQRGTPSVRLVQDFGGPDGPMGTLNASVPSGQTASMEAPPVPVKRGRGRPPGSRNKSA
jgi:hypothetical protein